MSTTIDLQFQGRPGVIATAVIPVGGGVVLVDPGPTLLPAGARGGTGRAAARPGRRARAPAHAHPSRPRRARPARIGAAAARAAGVRPRHRRPASGQPGEAAGQRDAPLRRGDGPAVGRVPGRARGVASVAGRRRDARSRRAAVRRGLHAGSRRAPRELPRSRRRHRLRRRHRRASGSVPATCSRRRRRRTSISSDWEESLQRIEAWRRRGST